MTTIILVMAVLGQNAKMGQGDYAIRPFGPPVPHIQDPYYWTPYRHPGSRYQGMKYPWLYKSGPPIYLYRNPNFDPSKVNHGAFYSPPKPMNYWLWGHHPKP